ncbi:MAG TPA: selenium-binding protein SBP56-related protein [Gemmatimonadaceae bacterium]|nr:selenium-binding protein SBP56-related protein [Gemmatimonadaceae bacterium]
MSSVADLSRTGVNFSRPGVLPDPTFYPSPRTAAKAPPETLAYVALINPADDGRPDAIGIVDLDTTSNGFGTVVGRLELPYAGDELHHFGWNACSSALCPFAPHPHVERRYLIVPGIRSSRIYVIDTRPNPAEPQIVKIIEPRELMEKTGYSRPHTVHCGPDGIYMSALGSADGHGPGGIFVLDHDSFDVLGRWEIDRGPQNLAYDFWWHLGYDTLMTSEWGTPDMVETGLQPQLLMEQKYGRHVHFFDLRRRRHVQSLQVEDGDQMTLELRPAHDPTKAYGFVGVVVSVKDLSASVYTWYRERDRWAMRKVITIPAEPADPAQLPDALKPFGAVPPLVSDIDLSVDDRFLYVSCWGTGELRQYDVSDPFEPKQTGSIHLGGIVRRAEHPMGGGPLSGGPQMVEVSRDGRRVYFTNSLYIPWDAQFYPAGISGWMAKVNTDPNGGMSVDPGFFPRFEDGLRSHQVRLQGGDASSDSYCYP